MYTRMVVPLDGSRRSAAVVPHAIQVATNLRCAVALVRVLPQRKAKAELEQERRVTKLNEVASEIGKAERYLQAVASRFEKEGIMTWKEIRSGEPAVEILKAAQDFGADLIAMATRSRRGLEKLIFGSVAEQVLMRSEIPVLLISSR